MSSYGMEFPVSAEFKDGMFSTLEKLELYQRPNLTSGELTAQMISDMYNNISKQMFRPESIYVSPATFAGLSKLLK